MPKKTHNSHLPAAELAAGSLFLALALCLRAVCRRAVEIPFDIRYGSFRAGSGKDIFLQNLPALGLIALYILTSAALLFFSRRIRVKLRTVVKNRRLELDLLAAARHLMTAAALLALLAFSVQAARLPNLKDISEPPVSGASGPEILSSTQVICHAMGAPDGHDYLNCLEGFEEMYAQGVRVFEVDMLMTADGSVVLRHEWENPFQEGIGPSSIPTKEEFLAQPILGQYTPLSFRDLLLLMEQYPDVCVVTDTKYAAPDIAAAQLHSMLEDAESLGLAALFDRIIIQVYNPDMLDTLDRVYHFPHYIFTLYQFGFEQTEEDFRKKAEFCASRGVQGITMWASLWNPAYAPIAQEYGVEVYVHTVNDLGEARELLNTGVSAVYTDTLTDALLTEGS